MKEKMKSWGKEIWDKKQKEQGSLGVIGGTIATKEFLNERTIKEFKFLDKEVFPLIKKSAKILDAGLGPFAKFSIGFAKRGYSVTGIDISPNVLDIAKRRISKSGYSIKLFEDDLTNIKRIRNKQDMVFCFGTFGHIPAFLSLKVLQEFNNVLKKGGYAYVHFWINKEKNPKELLHDFFYDLGHYIKIKNKKGHKVNCSFYTEEEIKDMAKLSNFEIVSRNESSYLLKKV